MLLMTFIILYYVYIISKYEKVVKRYTGLSQYHEALNTVLFSIHPHVGGKVSTKLQNFLSNIE